MFFEAREIFRRLYVACQRTDATRATEEFEEALHK